jgi:hypothetical protein
MKHITFIVLALFLAASMGTAMAHPDATVKAAPHLTDEQAIVRVMKQQFDKPNSPLTAMPLAVEGEWAMAGWLQDGRGGRALLNKRQGQWVIVVCGGDGLRQAGTLAQTGMKAHVAQTLAQKLQSAESRLPAETLRKFSSFEGMLRVDSGAHGAHGTHHKH